MKTCKIFHPVSCFHLAHAVFELPVTLTGKVMKSKMRMVLKYLRGNFHFRHRALAAFIARPVSMLSRNLSKQRRCFITLSLPFIIKAAPIATTPFHPDSSCLTRIPTVFSHPAEILPRWGPFLDLPCQVPKNVQHISTSPTTMTLRRQRCSSAPHFYYVRYNVRRGRIHRSVINITIRPHWATTAAEYSPIKD